ncbi:MAG: hypothetical protein ACLPSF_00085 [Methylocella sp.]
MIGTAGGLSYLYAAGGRPVLALHDDDKREYAYGPAKGLPDIKVGTFTQELLRGGEEGRLDRRQHEERLEAHLRIRLSAASPALLPRFTNGSAPRPR